MPAVRLAQYELCDLIPHAGRMCLLREVAEWDEGRIVCTATSHRDLGNPLRSQGRLSAVHALEYGAQAMAVHGGLKARALGGEIRPAYLAALRDVKLGVQRLDTLEDPLLIEATCLLAECSNLIYAFMVSSGATAVAAGRAIIVTNPEACRT